ncbi:MAG TPA: metallophosphoesterase [Anaeromyxobacteraceae bacterium]|nr:metallophosphoesterase [Anaeromyxobacteraceae bacterium]
MPGAAGRRVRLAALAALVAGASGCCRCARSPAFAKVGEPPAASPAAQARLPPLARILHFGDYGDDTCQQAAVAGAMLASHQRAPFQLAVSAGDNVYECGLDRTLPGASGCTFAADGNTVLPGYVPPRDPLVAERFERLLSGLTRDGFAVPVHLALGNHDVGLPLLCEGRTDPVAQRRRACLQVAYRAPQWSMPGRHYAVDAGPARLLVIDSNLLIADYGGFTIDGEVAFLESQASACAEPGRFCFVVAHHPAATASGHRDDLTPGYRARLARLERAATAAGGRIAGWLAGHDHDLQHLRTPAGYDVFVSGNTSRGHDGERFERLAPPAARLLFASNAWGFGRLEMVAGGWSYRFENDRGQAIHCCSASGQGPCQPVACPPAP